MNTIDFLLDGMTSDKLFYLSQYIEEKAKEKRHEEHMARFNSGEQLKDIFSLK